MQVAAAQSQPLVSSLYQTYNATAAQVGYGQCNESNPVVLTSPGAAPAKTLTGEPLIQLTDAEAQATIGEHLPPQKHCYRADCSCIHPPRLAHVLGLMQETSQRSPNDDSLLLANSLPKDWSSCQYG